MVEQGVEIQKLEHSLARTEMALKRVAGKRTQLVGGEYPINPRYDLSQVTGAQRVERVFNRIAAVTNYDEKVTSRLQAYHQKITDSIQTYIKLSDTFSKLDEAVKLGYTSKEIADETKRQLLTPLKREATVTTPTKKEEPVKPEQPQKESKSKPSKPERKVSKPKGKESIEVFGKVLTGLTPLKKKAIEGGLTASEVAPISTNQWVRYIYEEADRPGGISMKVATERFVVLKGKIDKDLAKVGAHIVNLSTTGGKKFAQKASYYITTLPEQEAKPIQESKSAPSKPEKKVMPKRTESIRVLGRVLNSLTPLQKRAIGVLSKGSDMLPVFSADAVNSIYKKELRSKKITLKQARDNFSVLKIDLKKDLARIRCAIVTIPLAKELRKSTGSSVGYYIAPIPELTEDRSTTVSSEVGEIPSQTVQGVEELAEEDSQNRPTLKDVVNLCGGLPKIARLRTILEEIGKGGESGDLEEITRIIHQDRINSGELSLKDAKVLVATDISKMNRDMRAQGIAIENTTSYSDRAKGKSAVYKFSRVKEIK